jgi:uncharacterized protein YihD (DUF1040 family)
MRDPARIDRILKLLEQRWKEQPDQRLGQLVTNFSTYVDDAGWAHEIDVFNREDDEIEASLARGWERLK